MSFRVSPLWWPIIALSSPLLFPLLFFRNRQFKQYAESAQALNEERIKKAGKLELPELTHFALSVLVEHKAEQGFLHSPGVSYLINTDQGALLFDVGYGPENSVLASNAKHMHFTMDQVDGVVISHLHPDHMGGVKAARENQVILPQELEPPAGMTCFLPAKSRANGFKVKLVEAPGMLSAGVASTGPLARSLFLMGWTEEQAIVARIKDKGLVIFTGCGHPTIETIIRMVRKLSDEPIYAVGGGLHFPVTDSPFQKAGVKVQMILGTGKPPWQKITVEDLEQTIAFLNEVKPKHVFLSAHDTCDYSIDRFKNDLSAETTVLRAGATYTI